MGSSLARNGGATPRRKPQVRPSRPARPLPSRRPRPRPTPRPAPPRPGPKPSPNPHVDPNKGPHFGPGRPFGVPRVPFGKRPPGGARPSLGGAGAGGGGFSKGGFARQALPLYAAAAIGGAVAGALAGAFWPGNGGYDDFPAGNNPSKSCGSYFGGRQPGGCAILGLELPVNPSSSAIRPPYYAGTKGTTSYTTVFGYPTGKNYVNGWPMYICTGVQYVPAGPAGPVKQHGGRSPEQREGGEGANGAAQSGVGAWPAPAPAPAFDPFVRPDPPGPLIGPWPGPLGLPDGIPQPQPIVWPISPARPGDFRAPAVREAPDRGYDIPTNPDPDLVPDYLPTSPQWRQWPTPRPRPRKNEENPFVYAPPGISSQPLPIPDPGGFPFPPGPLDTPKVEYKIESGREPDGYTHGRPRLDRNPPRRPPRPPERERKAQLTAAGKAVESLIGQATEVGDFLHVLKNSLSSAKRRNAPKRIDQLAWYIYENADDIDVERFVPLLINDQVEDYLWSLGGKEARRISKEAGLVYGWTSGHRGITGRPRWQDLGADHISVEVFHVPKHRKDR